MIVDVSLLAYTQYNYSVTASNSAGSVTSDWTTATTSQAEPSGLAAPTCQTYSDQLDTIRLFWSPPAMTNGQLSAVYSN